MKNKHKNKVFYGHNIIAGKDYECIVSAPSRKRVSEITGLPVSYLANYWTETGNKEDIDTATASPETYLVRRLNSRDPYKAISK